MRRRIVLAAALALGLAGAGAATAQDGAPPARVSISHFAFEPARLTVEAGTTVSWVNHDEESHTVTAVDRSYASAGLEREEVYTHRYAAPGTYIYFCALHPHMTAIVVVR